jgi:hypothetical protein
MNYVRGGLDRFKAPAARVIYSFFMGTDIVLKRVKSVCFGFCGSTVYYSLEETMLVGKIFL